MSIDNLVELEKRGHFWIKGKQQVVKDIIWRLQPDDLLDVGCGTGVFLKQLSSRTFSITGVDILAEAIERCQDKLPQATFIQADAINLPLDNAGFDAVLALEVLEHVPEYDQLMQEVVRVLKPGGHAIVSVPAYSRLFSQKDIEAGHVRRFNKNDLTVCLEKAGLTIKYFNYFNFFLFPFFIISRKFNLNERNPGLITNFFFSLVMQGEARLAKYLTFPWGSSMIAIGEKPYV